MRERLPGKKKTIFLAAAIVALLLVTLFLSVKITDITVTGSERYTDEQLINLLFPDKVRRNTAVCYLRDRLKEHEKIPFVEDYKLEFKGLNRLEIIVYEKSVVGCVSYMSSYMYFDKDGIVVESANRELSGVPRITGLKFGPIALDQKLTHDREQKFDEILKQTKSISI